MQHPAPRTTLDLLNSALTSGSSARGLAKELGLSNNALNAAKHRGYLSPTEAGTLAAAKGEDPILWTAIAALETAPATPQRDKLMSRLLKGLKSLFKHRRSHRKPRLRKRR